MRFRKFIGMGLLCLFLTSIVHSQQLKLGSSPASMQKSALLELSADRQGLLMPRISDTALINSLNPPDGMTIFFTPAKKLLVRSNGYWSEMVGLINGSLGIGSSTFDATNREKLLVDAGTTSSYNLITGKGTINNYLQINVQNQSNGTQASSDVVATANNGSETSNFVNMGINSGGFNNTTYPMIGGINTAYLYSTGNDFSIGNATSGKYLRFFTGGYTAASERLTIDGNGNVGISTATPTAKLDAAGTFKLGAKGTVNKNLTSFAGTISSTSVPAGTASTVTVIVTVTTNYSSNYTDITVNIPTANQPTSTQATVSVSPAADLPATVSIAYARLISTTQLKIRFLNSSTTAASVSGTFYFTITEF